MLPEEADEDEDDVVGAAGVDAVEDDVDSFEPLVVESDFAAVESPDDDVDVDVVLPRESVL